MTDNKDLNTASAPTFHEQSAAYERVLPRLRAITPEQWVTLTLEVTSTVSTVLGVVPEVKALRAQIMDELPKLDIGLIDALEDAALALWYVHNKSTSTKAGGALVEMAERAVEIRSRLLADLRVAVQHGVLDGARIHEVGSKKGYRNIASDLGTLARMFREVWNVAPARWWVTEADINEAYVLSTELVRAVGLREQAGPTLDDASIERNNAVTFLVLCYDEARRAVQHLRWKERDADRIAPSLYTRRSKKRRASEAASDTHATMPSVTEHTEVTDA
jgi:hypothetical protein